MTTPVRDWLGQEIEETDIVVYIATGRYASHSNTVAQVSEVRKRVKIRPLHKAPGYHALTTGPFWVDGSSLTVVEAFKSFRPGRPS